jgi:3-phenylpropionate/trans-cinnamate dioxygenase ferredoxin reductase subunit
MVIAGGGLAGAKAAESLRGWGFDGRIVLVGTEIRRPYDRPPLSKYYLRGEVDFADITIHPEAFYRSHEIELLTDVTVTGLDPAARRIRLEPGGELAYDRLLLATGARPRRLDVPGMSLPGVFYLREAKDAEGIRQATQAGSRAVVVGTGFIGTEVAASLRAMGAEVVLVGRSSVPLGRILGNKVATAVADLHVEHGVELRSGVTVRAVHGSLAVQAVELDDGAILPCDLVVVGLGVVPRTELAEQAGIAVSDGVLTDDRLRTSAPGVFAAGDVANAVNAVLGVRLRSEHWWSALTQGPVAAANMAGQAARYDWIPTFTSEQFGVTIEHTGHAPEWDEIVLRGDRSSRRFAAFWARRGAVLAGLTFGVPGMARHIRSLVVAGWTGRTVDTKALADVEVDLAALADAAKSNGKETPEVTNHVESESHARPEINEGLRQWYESCPCCMSQALPEVKQALDDERAAESMHH